MKTVRVITWFLLLTYFVIPAIIAEPIPSTLDKIKKLASKITGTGNKLTTSVPQNEIVANASKTVPIYGSTLPSNTSGVNQSTPGYPFSMSKFPSNMTTRAPNQSISYTQVYNARFYSHPVPVPNNTINSTAARIPQSGIVANNANASKAIQATYNWPAQNTSGVNQSTTGNPFLVTKLPVNMTTTRARNQSIPITSVNKTRLFNQPISNIGIKSTTMSVQQFGFNANAFKWTAGNASGVGVNQSAAGHPFSMTKLPLNMTTTRAPNQSIPIPETLVSNNGYMRHKQLRSTIPPHVHQQNLSNSYNSFTSNHQTVTHNVSIFDNLTDTAKTLDKPSSITPYEDFVHITFQHTATNLESDTFSACIPTCLMKDELQKRTLFMQYEYIRSIEDLICYPSKFQYCDPYVKPSYNYTPEKAEPWHNVLGSCACIKEPKVPRPMVSNGDTCYLQVYSVCNIQLDNPLYSVFPDSQPLLQPRCVPNSDCTPVFGIEPHVRKCICRSGYRSEPRGWCVRSKVNKSSPVLMLVVCVIISILINNFRYSLSSL